LAPDAELADVRVWRCSRSSLTLGWFGVGALGITVVVSIAVGAAAAVVPAVLAAAVVYSAVLRPRVVLAGARLHVVNPWRSITIRWDDVLDANAGFGGVSIMLRSGAVVTAWAVQKSNLSGWVGRTTRADELAAAIRARAHTSIS